MIGSVTALWLNDIVPLFIFIIFVLRDLLILLGAAFEMSITEQTPSPNFVGKLTTASQIIYILGLILIEIFKVLINTEILHILISLITVFSLISYFNWWITSNFNQNNA
jgi:cardiolipin synthase